MHIISESEKTLYRLRRERIYRQELRDAEKKKERASEYERTHTPRLMRILPVIKLYVGCWELDKVHKHQLGLQPKVIAETLTYNVNTTRGYIRRFKLKPDTGPTNNYQWNILHTFIYNYEGYSEDAISNALNVDLQSVRNYRKFIEEQITEPDWDVNQ